MAKRGRPTIGVIRRAYPGRTPWFTITVNGTEHYLGTDASAAYSRAAELTKGEPRPEAQTVARLVLEAINKAPKDAWKLLWLGRWVARKGGIPLDEWRPAMFGEFADLLVAAGTLMPRTIRRYLYEARMLLKANKLECGPAKTPPPVPNPKDVDPAIVKEALIHIHRAGAIVRFILATGCRPGEACSMTWDMIEGDVVRLDRHKTRHHGKSRTLYLTPAAKAVLEGLTKGSGIVFLNRDGKPYTANAIRCALRRNHITGGYVLRHTAAQQWLDKGVPMEDVAALLGHSDMRTVGVYARVKSKRSREVASRIPDLL